MSKPGEVKAGQPIQQGLQARIVSDGVLNLDASEQQQTGLQRAFSENAQVVIEPITNIEMNKLVVDFLAAVQKNPKEVTLVLTVIANIQAGIFDDEQLSALGANDSVNQAVKQLLDAANENPELAIESFKSAFATDYKWFSLKAGAVDIVKADAAGLKLLVDRLHEQLVPYLRLQLILPQYVEAVRQGVELPVEVEQELDLLDKQVRQEIGLLVSVVANHESVADVKQIIQPGRNISLWENLLTTPHATIVGKALDDAHLGLMRLLPRSLEQNRYDQKEKSTNADMFFSAASKVLRNTKDRRIFPGITSFEASIALLRAHVANELISQKQQPETVHELVAGFSGADLEQIQTLLVLNFPGDFTEAWCNKAQQNAIESVPDEFGKLDLDALLARMSLLVDPVKDIFTEKSMSPEQRKEFFDLYIQEIKQGSDIYPQEVREFILRVFKPFEELAKNGVNPDQKPLVAGYIGWLKADRGMQSLAKRYLSNFQTEFQVDFGSLGDEIVECLEQGKVRDAIALAKLDKGLLFQEPSAITQQSTLWQLAESYIERVNDERHPRARANSMDEIEDELYSRRDPRRLKRHNSDPVNRLHVSQAALSQSQHFQTTAESNEWELLEERINTTSLEELNQPSAAGDTLLYRAAEAGNEKLVRALVDRGVDVDKRVRTNSTPLGIAAERGHLAVVQILVENGAKISPQEFDRLVASSFDRNIQTNQAINERIERNIPAVQNTPFMDKQFLAQRKACIALIVAKNPELQKADVKVQESGEEVVEAQLPGRKQDVSEGPATTEDFVVHKPRPQLAPKVGTPSKPGPVSRLTRREMLTAEGGLPSITSSGELLLSLPVEERTRVESQRGLFLREAGDLVKEPQDSVTFAVLALIKQGIINKHPQEVHLSPSHATGKNMSANVKKAHSHIYAGYPLTAQQVIDYTEESFSAKPEKELYHVSAIKFGQKLDAAKSRYVAETLTTAVKSRINENEGNRLSKRSVINLSEAITLTQKAAQDEKVNANHIEIAAAAAVSTKQTEGGAEIVHFSKQAFKDALKQAVKGNDEHVRDSKWSSVSKTFASFGSTFAELQQRTSHVKRWATQANQVIEQLTTVR